MPKRHVPIDPLSSRIVLPVLLSGLIIHSTGCSTTAPITTWQPSKLQANSIINTKEPKRVAFVTITGPEALSSRLEQALANTKPAGSTHIAMLSPQSLSSPPLGSASPIQLASHQKKPNPMSTLETVKASGAELMIQGHITMADFELEKEEAKRPANPNSPGAAMAVLQQYSNKPVNERPEHMIVTWEAYEVPSGKFVNAATVSLNRTQAEEQYPELAFVADPVDRLLTGVSRQTWSQFAPTLEETEVTLQNPYWSWGSKEVRQGNTVASNGLWQQADFHWQNVVSTHPKNKAAWHNMAVSAVAQEDFELARLRLSRAKGWLPNKKVKETEQWIDAQQKAYHQSFGLPPREGGWLEPDPVLAPETSEVPEAEAVDIDKLPWWTAIPFTKPPGWTWKAWLTQPLP